MRIKEKGRLEEKETMKRNVSFEENAINNHHHNSDYNASRKNRRLQEECLIDLPAPPDGGWGWVICMACFICNLVLDGISYTFGVLLLPLVRHFDSNQSTVSWLGSLLVGVYLMSGPLVGGLVNRYGCRPVCIAGSVLAALALALSTFSPNLMVMLVLYGLIGGLGLGLVYLPAVVAVGYYFEKRRALATGIAVCGSGVGTFLFAPLSTYLVASYGWQTANLVFAGLCLSCSLCGLLMRPLEMPEEQEKKLQEGNYRLQLPDGHEHLMPPQRSSSPTLPQKHLPTIEEQLTLTKESSEKRASLTEAFPDIEMDEIKEAPKFLVTPVANTQQTSNKANLPRNSSAPHFVTHDNRASLSDAMAQGFSSQLRLSVGHTEHGMSHGSSSHLGYSRHHLQPSGHNSNRRLSLRPMSRKDVFFSGSVLHLEEPQPPRPSFDHARRLSSSSHITHALSTSVVSMRRSSLFFEEIDERTVLDVLREMTDWHLLREPSFLLIGISNVLGMLGFYVPFVFLVNMASEAGIASATDAGLLISVIGVANTLGRVLIGAISDAPFVNPLVLTNLAILGSGLCVLCCPLCTTYSMLMGLALLFGLCVAAYISLTSIVLVDLVGIERLTSAFGLLTLFRGSASMVGPPIAGAVCDLTRGYDATFYGAGACLVAAALIGNVADFCHRKKHAMK